MEYKAGIEAFKANQKQKNQELNNEQKKHKQNVDNNIKLEDESRQAFKEKLAAGLDDIKTTLKNEEDAAKAANKIKIEEYNLSKEKMKDPMFYRQMKNEAVREIYTSMSCSNYRVRSATGTDPIVQALDSLM